MAADLSDVLSRLAVLQESLLTDSVAAPYQTYIQAGQPYWTNAASLTGAVKKSDAIVVFTFQITQRLYFGNLGQRYDGKLELALAGVLYDLVVYLAQHPRLAQLPTYPALDSIDPPGLGINRANFVTGGEEGDALVLECVISVPLLVTFTSIGD